MQIGRGGKVTVAEKEFQFERHERKFLQDIYNGLRDDIGEEEKTLMQEKQVMVFLRKLSEEAEELERHLKVHEQINEHFRSLVSKKLTATSPEWKEIPRLQQQMQIEEGKIEERAKAHQARIKYLRKVIAGFEKRKAHYTEIATHLRKWAKKAEGTATALKKASQVRIDVSVK
ncbi:MAG: hypothetical protein ACOCWQ_00440 [Nanoarchaeota archaeon]